MDGLRLRRAGVEDIPFVMATERLPGYGQVVGRWSLVEHQAALASPDTAYLIAGEGAGAVTAGSVGAGETRLDPEDLASCAGGQDASAGPAGFVILEGIEEGEGNVCLRRVAVTRPGAGFGRRLLAAAIGWVWRETGARRLWLDVASHNARARHVYGKLGFVEEGVLRGEHRLPDGGTVELVVMGMRRGEWEAKRDVG